MSLEMLIFCRALVIGRESFGLGTAGSEFPWTSAPSRDYLTLGPLVFDIEEASALDGETTNRFKGIPRDFKSCITISDLVSAFDARSGG